MLSERDLVDHLADKIAERLVARGAQIKPDADVCEIPETAALLKIKPSTLARYATREPYKSMRISNGTKRVLFSRAKIAAYLAGSLREAAASPGSRPVLGHEAGRKRSADGRPGFLRPVRMARNPASPEEAS